MRVLITFRTYVCLYLIRGSDDSPGGGVGWLLEARTLVVISLFVMPHADILPKGLQKVGVLVLSPLCH